jgi:DNA-binding NarL/FixJ family response regulator
MSYARVLTADDHIIFSEGLQSLLEDKFEIVGSVTDGRAMLEAARNLNPDVIVADISMPVLNGLAAVRQLRREGNHTKVVFLTMHCEAQIAIEAFRVGAMGYVLKQSAGDELIAALHAALEGQSYVTPLVTQEIHQLLLGGSEHKACILQLLAEGRSPAEIGCAVKISTEEVEAQLHEMKQDMGSNNAPEFLRLASQLGLISIHPVVAV